MSKTFLATLDPMLTLFLCMAIGYAVKRTGIVTREAASSLSRLETWVFCPALSFITMARYCTLSSLATHGFNVLLAGIAIALAVAIATPLSALFTRERSLRGIYKYALAFGNFGYLGDPIILALFGGEALAYYKLFTLPLTVMVYSWGFTVLVPETEQKGSVLKRLLNLPLMALLVGVAVGISGLGEHLPAFFVSTMDSLTGCMGPVAMLIAGITVASYGFRAMLTDKRVYVATLLRLFVLPAVIVAAVYGAKELINLVFDAGIGNAPLHLAFFAFAAPLGLNTVVFPEAYGGDPAPGASMAMISHTLCIVSIPLLYSLLTVIFGPMAL